MRAGRLVLHPIIDRYQRDGDGSDCFREGEACRVRLWGRLPPAWAGNLALHACGLGLEIVSGDATRIGATHWAATFLLRSADPRAPIARHDYLQMARRAPMLVPRLPEPNIEIHLEEPGEDGLLVARVQGKDSIGLLAELLRRFEASCLRPREFCLRTEQGRIDDRFWLEPL
jgi:hypothetical protein